MHHSHAACNYGLCFNYWDRVMDTNHATYRRTFDAITARRAPVRAPAAIGCRTAQRTDRACRAAIGLARGGRMVAYGASATWGYATSAADWTHPLQIDKGSSELSGVRGT